MSVYREGGDICIVRQKREELDNEDVKLKRFKGEREYRKPYKTKKN